MGSGNLEMKSDSAKTVEANNNSADFWSVESKSNYGSTNYKFASLDDF